MSAEKEIERLEREINAKAGGSSGGGSGSSSGSGGTGRSGPLASDNNGNPPKKGGGDSVLLAIGVLVFFSVVLPMAGKLKPDQVTALSAGAMGSAAGIAVGFVLGRSKRR